MYTYDRFYGDYFKVTDPAELKPYLVGIPGFGEIRLGDYMFVDSHGLTDAGEYQNSHHGFVVVGWGPPVDCMTVFGDPDSYSRLEPTGELTMASTDTTFVPYVSDFSLGAWGETLRWQQYPGPRPFYCVRVPHPNEEDFVNAGIVAPPDLIDSYAYGSLEFYQIPDSFVLDDIRLYSPDFDAWIR